MDPGNCLEYHLECKGMKDPIIIFLWVPQPFYFHHLCSFQKANRKGQEDVSTQNGTSHILIVTQGHKYFSQPN